MQWLARGSRSEAAPSHRKALHMNNRLAQRITIAAMALVIPFSGMQPAIAEPDASSTSSSLPASTAPASENVDEILEFIDAIPDDVVNNGSERDFEIYLQSRAGTITYGAWGCAGAITAVIAGTVVPISKVWKLAKWVKQLGGASKTAKYIEEAGGIRNIIKTRGKSVKAKQYEQILLSLAAEFIGIDQIQANC